MPAVPFSSGSQSVVWSSEDDTVASVDAKKPDNAEYQPVVWSSSDESIAIVDEKGQITGLKGGNVVITATSTEPVTGKAKPKVATCKVEVVQPVEYIALEKDEKKSTNKQLYLKLTVLPETATNKKVKWTTSNKKVATVKNGKVSIKKHDGTATITATSTDGTEIYGSCEVTVGFSGVFMQIGSYVYREGTYTWDVGNFTGNGVMPGTKETESSTEGSAV